MRITDIVDNNTWLMGEQANETWVIDGREMQLVSVDRMDRLARILADFYRAPLTMASVQPILDLAVELNPDLKTQPKYEMPNPRQPLTIRHSNGRFSCTDCGISDAPCHHFIEQRQKDKS